MTDIPLCASGLSPDEKQRLLGLLTALAGFLGAPGDWGYGTRLSRFTWATLDICAAVRSAPTTEAETYEIGP